MIVKATRNGTYPAGNHWVAGEVRKLEVEGPLPVWLVEVPVAKKKSSKAKPKTESE